MTETKIRAKTSRMLKHHGEPTINPMDYTTSLVRALNWYNVEVDGKAKRTWTLNEFKKERGLLDSVHDREFRQIGTLIRIRANGNTLAESEEKFIQSELNRILELAKSNTAKAAVKRDEDTSPVVRITAEDRNKESASQLMAEFNSMIDDYTIDRNNTPNLLALKKLLANAAVAKLIVPRLEKMIQELTLALSGTDEQLNEGYSIFKKPELKKLLATYEQFVKELGQNQKVSQPRVKAKKEVPPAKIVASVKYKPDSPELGLKSIPPVRMLGTIEVWCYNTKYKRLQKYVAVQGETISVRGTTLLNFDPTKSTQLGIRKPEALKELNGKGRISHDQYLKTLKTVHGTPTGRLNEDTIILAAFTK